MSTNAPSAYEAQFVIRSGLAALPATDADTDRREVSKCLIVQTEYDTLACVTDMYCLAIVQIEGEARGELSFDLSIAAHANIGLPMVVQRKDGESELFRGVEIDGKWKSIGAKIRVEDHSDPAKFPKTDFIVEPVDDTDLYRVVRISARRLQKLADALIDISGDDDDAVSLIVPKEGEIGKLRVQGRNGIGVLMTPDPSQFPSDLDTISRFNRTAEQFNQARAAAAQQRNGGAQ